MNLLGKKKPRAIERLPYRDLIGHFQDLLNEATTEREDRRDFVTLDDGTAEFGWVLYERAVMRDEVNRLRQAKGLDPVDDYVLLRVESQASGHIDYVLKYAIGCADLVLGQGSWSD